MLCIFADDLSSFQAVVDRLKSWATLEGASKPFERVRPSVVIVRRGAEAGPSPTNDLLEMQGIESGLDRTILRSSYSTVKVLHLVDEQISPLARFRRLKELLRRQMDEMRNTRFRYGCLYSAVHLNALFRVAVVHTARSILHPFDFVTATRSDNEVGSDYASHLSSFLLLGKRFDLSGDTVANYIASGILLDAYTPGMHRRLSAGLSKPNR